MRLDRLDAAGLRALEDAVRAGEPVALGEGACEALPRGIAADEVVPLCHAVEDAALARWLPPAARPGSGLAASVVLPSSRGRPLGIAALEAQDVAVELLVLANGEQTEGIRVPWRGHGPTRQLGVEMARHPYVAFTVDDAVPLGAGWLRTLIEALEAGGYDAVFARQVPWPTSDPVTRARLRAWTPPDEGHRAVDRHDHVAAVYRRETLLRDPLPDLPIAEDWHWGRRHRIGYVATAPVVHAHERRFLPLYRRTRDIHRERVRGGEAPAVPSVAALLRALPGVVGRDAPGALGELLGQWVAGRGR